MSVGNEANSSDEKPVLSGQAAIDAVQRMIDGLRDEDVGFYNLDAAHVSTLLGAVLPRLEAFYGKFEQLLEFDVASVRALATLLHALLHANGLVLAHSPETSPFDDLAIEARAHRETLLIVAMLLVAKGEIKESVVEDIRAGHGVYDLINDLTALRAIAEAHPEQITGQRAVSDRVAELIVQLPPSYAQRIGKDPKLAPLLNQRKKIGALIIRGYAEAQAGVAYLRRRQKDADTIIPSLYVSRGPTKKKSDDAEGPDEGDKDAAAKPAPAPAPVPAKPANPLLPSDNPFDNKS